MALFLDDTPFDAGDFIGKLVPNLWSFLINLLALVVLFVALYFIAYKPVKKFVKARKDYIEGNIRSSERGKEEVEKTLRKKDSIIAEAREEGNKIIASSKDDANKRAAAIVESAQDEARSIKLEAEKDIAEANGYKRSDDIVKETIRYIKAKKAAGQTPEDIKTTYRASEKTSLQFYKEYEDRKYAMLCLDFDDLIQKAIEVLEGFPAVREKWANRYSHILIDEFQDTNDAQERVVSLLSRPDTSLYVVGDPDQTIYTWRGADQKIILRFPEEHPGTQDIFLSRNYRSTANILNSANKLIAHNKQRVPKDLYTFASNGDPVTAKRFFNQNEEAQWVAGKIESIANLEGGVQFFSREDAFF